MALIEFKNLPDTSTPLSAENLNNNFDELNKKTIQSEVQETVNDNETLVTEISIGGNKGYLDSSVVLYNNVILKNEINNIKDKINNTNRYTLNESQEVGTWLGKKLYRYTIKSTVPIVNSDGQNANNDVTIPFKPSMVIIEHAIINQGNYWLTCPYVSDANHATKVLFKNDNIIRISNQSVSYSSKEIYISFLYTLN